MASFSLLILLSFCFSRRLFAAQFSLPLELRAPSKNTHSLSSRGIPHVAHVFDYHTPNISRMIPIDLLGGISVVGEYYARVLIGGQPVRVQIDTGSSTLALPVAACVNCLPTDQRYNPLLSEFPSHRSVSCMNKLCQPDVCGLRKCKTCSSTNACCADHNPDACAFKLSYGDQSFAHGELMVDTLSWGNISSPVVFGGILEDSHDFERPMVDGILGMGYETLACNPTCVEPPLQQMVKAGVITDSFSICIAPESGRLILGGFDPSMAKTKLTYVPLALSNPPLYYTVNVSNKITIGEHNLVLPNFRAGILDSGTTLVVVSKPTFSSILRHIRRFYCHIKGICSEHSWFKPFACIKLPDEEINKLPKFVFHLGSNREFDVELRPEDYMVRLTKPGKIGYRCVGFMVLEKMHHGTDVIFGNTVMQRYVTHYDRQNKRLGFAEAVENCGSTISCESYTQCVECAAAAPRCAFDYRSHICRSAESSLGIVPYPLCTGASCLCKLGPQAPLVFGIVSGFFSTLVIGSVGLLILALYTRRGFHYQRQMQSPEYEIGAEDDPEERDSFDESEYRQPTKGARPFAAMDKQD